MGKLAFVFPGQGAQYVGMGKEIASEYSAGRRMFEEASDSLGYDVSKMVFDGDEQTLKITENTQPAILTASMACLAPILEKGINPDYVAGLSLGEYTAHVAADTFSFADAVKIVRKRGKFMQEEVPEGVGTMAAILGLDNDTVKDCCQRASSVGVVEPANFNCPGQIVVSGEVKAVEALCNYAKESGAKRAMVLPVSAPFHCSMLEGAGNKLEAELKNIEFNNMKIPVVSNVNADLVENKNCVKDLLVKQVSNCVLWEASVKRLLELGVDNFIEIGPGKVLSGFVKKISREVKISNVENLSTLHDMYNVFGA